MRKFILIGFILFVIALFYISFFRGQKNNIGREITRAVTQLNSAVGAPSPTPYPFQEITIPALRSREYKSKLGTLEEVSQNGNYTSYLTSYDSDGLKVNGLLTKPEGEEPAGGWPAIIFLHGYIPPTIYRTTQQYSDYVDYLASNGFVVFKIDLRGHADSEGLASGAYFSGDYIIDTLNAYSALQNSGFVNPEKIGLWGHSMAGNVVMRATAVKPEIPATVIWAGAVYTYQDMQDYGIDDNSYRPPEPTSQRQTRRQRLREIHGEYSPTSAFWQEIAPSNYLQDLKGAIQINHAGDDNVVDIEYSRNLNSLLDKTSVPHEFNELSTGGHNISGGAFNQAMENTVSFFKKYLE